MALTRSKLLDAVVMAASFLLVCFLSYAYTADKSKASLLMAAFLFFLMPKNMWAQVVVWTSGFTNYVPSALITVAYLVSAKGITDQELSDRRDTPGYCVWMFVLGFAGALFVESITVFNICFAAAVIIYMFLKFRKYCPGHIGFFLGSVTGAGVMFSNGAYNRIAQGEDYYRHMPVGLRDTVYFALEQARNILNYILSDNFLFCVIVTVLLLTLTILRLKNGKKWVWVPAAFHGGSLLLLWFEDTVFNFMTSRFALSKLMTNLVPMVAPLLYVFSILIMVLCLVEKGRRFKMLLPFYCGVVSLVPLLVVDPIGPRCVFIGYFFMMVFAVDLFGYLCRQMHPEEKWLSRVLGLVVAAQLLFYFYIHCPIHYYDELRLRHIKKQAAEGRKTVLISDLPNSDYLWTPTPGGESWVNKYKLFYGLDEQLQFEQISYEELEELVKNGS